jgi:glycerol uptake facilitator-like aquaporin
MQISSMRRLVAEFMGTLLLLATVVGSGIMAERLAGGNEALALLANTIAIGAVLFVLILSLAGVSGAHFNPAVTVTAFLVGNLPLRDAVGYFAAQFAGSIIGVILANAMFGLPLILASQKVRTGPAIWLSEFVATFGLIFVIAATVRVQSKFAVPLAVAAYIFAASWFTPSTSFANPAVTLARSLSDTFAGIRPVNVPAFVVVQIVAAVAAMYVSRWLFGSESPA